MTPTKPSRQTCRPSVVVRGTKAARLFSTVATGQGMTVAEAARQWLAEERKKVLQGTIASHEAAFKRLERFLEKTEGMSSLEGVALSSIARRMAGELLSERRASGVGSMGDGHA